MVIGAALEKAEGPADATVRRVISLDFIGTIVGREGRSFR
jgi:hypothetical protein